MALAQSPEDVARAQWCFGAAIIILFGRIAHWLITSPEIGLPKPILGLIFFGISGASWVLAYQWVNAKLPVSAPVQSVTSSTTSHLSDAERPWVTVASVTSPDGIVVGKPAGVVVRYVNDGRSTALRVQSRVRIDTLPPGMKPTFFYQGIELNRTGIVGGRIR